MGTELQRVFVRRRASGGLDTPGDRYRDPGRAVGACPAAPDIPRAQLGF